MGKVYTVTIRKDDECGEEFVVRFKDRQLGGALAQALSATLEPRRDSGELARMVMYTLEYRDPEEEIWPGYNDALSRMLRAAEDLLEGWDRMDVKIGNKPDPSSVVPPRGS